MSCCGQRTAIPAGTVRTVHDGRRPKTPSTRTVTVRYRGTEAVVGHVGDLLEHQPHVGLVVLGHPGPPRGQHTGHAVERVDGEPGVVRDRRQSGVGKGVAGLDERVLLERGPGLRHVGRAGERIQADQTDLRAGLSQDAGQFAELALVLRGQHDGVISHAVIRHGGS